MISLEDFVNALKDGNENIIKGIYVPDILSLRVLQQPSGKPEYVSPVEGTVTQFALTGKYESIGILAHNFASGRLFFNLKIDDIVSVVYGDGKISRYKITQLKRYQALSPKSVNSTFIDLNTNIKLTASQLFISIYSRKNSLILQTCIWKDKEDSWGRLFVIAESSA